MSKELKEIKIHVPVVCLLMSKGSKEIKIHAPVVCLLMSKESKEIKIHVPVVCLLMSKGSKVPVQNVIVMNQQACSGNQHCFPKRAVIAGDQVPRHYVRLGTTSGQQNCASLRLHL